LPIVAADGGLGHHGRPIVHIVGAGCAGDVEEVPGRVVQGRVAVDRLETIGRRGS
jgi:hypothetical protein